MILKTIFTLMLASIISTKSFAEITENKALDNTPDYVKIFAEAIVAGAMQAQLDAACSNNTTTNPVTIENPAECHLIASGQLEVIGDHPAFKEYKELLKRKIAQSQAAKSI